MDSVRLGGSELRGENVPEFTPRLPTPDPGPTDGPFSELSDGTLSRLGYPSGSQASISSSESLLSLFKNFKTKRI